MSWLSKLGGKALNAVSSLGPAANLIMPGLGESASMLSSFNGAPQGTQYSHGTTPQVLGSNRVSNDPLSFDNITGAIKGIGGLADLFSGGAGGRVSDYNDQVFKANDLLTQYAYKQADKDYALAQQEYAAKQAYSAAAGAHAARAASARAAAARQEEENRLKAARQSLKIQKQGRKKADALFSPYYDTGHRALALSESLFNQGASMVGDIKSLIGDSKSGTYILNSVR